MKTASTLQHFVPIPVKEKLWAYYAPDGNLQVRSIGETKAEARRFICEREESVTYKDYEKAGYKLYQINAEITPIK